MVDPVRPAATGMRPMGAGVLPSSAPESQPLITGLGTGSAIPSNPQLHLTPPAVGELRPLRGAELTAARDAELQSTLARIVADLGVESMLREKRLSLTLVNLTNPDAPRFAGLNENTELYAASLPKIGVLVGALSLVAGGELDLDGTVASQFPLAARERFARQVAGSNSERRHFAALVESPGRSGLDRLTVRQLLAVMMQRSSNAVPALLHRHIGKDRLQKILADTGLFDRATDSGLWLGKFYGPDPRAERRYHRGGSQNATALQVARFYTLVATGGLFSVAMSDTAAEAMNALKSDGSAHLGHKFMHGLVRTSRPPVRVLRKSGTVTSLKTHADSALVEVRGDDGVLRRYALVMLARGAGAKGLAERLIEPVHQQMTR